MSTNEVAATGDWEARRSVIHDLYINKGHPLEHVMSTMRPRGLQDSKQQYEQQFKKWGLAKNHKAKEWQYISRALDSRALQSKSSIIFVRGLEILLEKVRKESRQNLS